jgi:hypothetical protein
MRREIYVESLMTAGSFAHFEIGKKLDLTRYVQEEHYNPIGDGSCGFYFFDRELDVEVFVKDDLIHSFDILLRHQDNQLFLGNESNRLHLQSCTLGDLISYLNKNNLSWKFRSILGEQSITVEYSSVLKMIFGFDCEENPPLTIISVFKDGY